MAKGIKTLAVLVRRSNTDNDDEDEDEDVINSCCFVFIADDISDGPTDIDIVIVVCFV